MHFILANAAKYDVDEPSLSAEIQQLGLPAEHSAAIIQLYGSARNALRKRFSDDSLRLSRLLSTKWRVDHILDSSSQVAGNYPTSNVLLKFVIENNPSRSHASQSFEEISFELSSEKLDALIIELSSAESIMSNIEKL